jgi:hypothetical protein
MLNNIELYLKWLIKFIILILRAVERRAHLVGWNAHPATGLLRPVATLEVIEVTKWLKPLV